jgi:hypothetical protein
MQLCVSMISVLLIFNFFNVFVYGVLFFYDVLADLTPSQVNATVFYFCLLL